MAAPFMDALEVLRKAPVKSTEQVTSKHSLPSLPSLLTNQAAQNASRFNGYNPLTAKAINVINVKSTRVMDNVAAQKKELAAELDALSQGIVAYQEAVLVRRETERLTKPRPKPLVKASKEEGEETKTDLSRDNVLESDALSAEDASVAASQQDLNEDDIEPPEKSSRLTQRRLTLAVLSKAIMSIGSISSLRLRDRRSIMKVHGYKHPEANEDGKHVYRIRELKLYAMTCVPVTEGAKRFLKSATVDAFIRDLLVYCMVYIKILRYRQKMLRMELALKNFQREEDNAEDEHVAVLLNEELRDIVQRVSRSYALLLLGSIDGKSTASIANMHREEQRFMALRNVTMAVIHFVLEPHYGDIYRQLYVMFSLHQRKPIEQVQLKSLLKMTEKELIKAKPLRHLHLQQHEALTLNDRSPLIKTIHPMAAVDLTYAHDTNQVPPSIFDDSFPRQLLHSHQAQMQHFIQAVQSSTNQADEVNHQRARFDQEVATFNQIVLE